MAQKASAQVSLEYYYTYLWPLLFPISIEPLSVYHILTQSSNLQEL